MEMIKILCLIERFQNSKFSIIYEGTTYDADTAVQHARNYIFNNYKKETADRWLKLYAFRSFNKRETIYLKYPSGKKRRAGDVLLEELNSLSGLKTTDTIRSRA